MSLDDDTKRRDLTGRLKALLIDMLVLLVGVLSLCVISFAVVHLFRVWHTGRLIVGGISSCSGFMSSIVWPVLILMMVILYRRQIMEALKEVPGFIRNYPAKEGAVSVARSTSDADDDKGALMANNSRQEGAGVSPRKQTGQKRQGHGVGSEFENYVLNTIQKESGILIFREVNLFSDKTYCFDGAMIRGDRVIGIEVCYGTSREYEHQLDKINQFYQRLSANDQKQFGLLYCVRGEQDLLLPQLERYRERYSFHIEYRFFRYDVETDRNEESKS